MIKLLLILLLGLLFESTGVVLLKKGMAELGEVKTANFAGLAKAVAAGVANPKIVLGVFFEALFFGSLLVLLHRTDVSVLWPLTALSFVFATVASIWFLQERVSFARWAGVVFIVIGAALVSYSQHPKSDPASAQPDQRPDPASRSRTQTSGLGLS